MNRNKRNWMYGLCAVLALGLVTALSACAGKREGPFDVPAAVSPGAEMGAPVVSGSNPAEQQAAAEIAASKIYFSFNKYELRPESEQALSRIAELLRLNPGLNVRIGGHCDERGSVEYNYALGERRARLAYSTLVGKGVSPSQLEMHSYSELVPAAPGKDEASYALNRRDEFETLGLWPSSASYPWKECE